MSIWEQYICLTVAYFRVLTQTQKRRKGHLLSLELESEGKAGLIQSVFRCMLISQLGRVSCQLFFGWEQFVCLYGCFLLFLICGIITISVEIPAENEYFENKTVFCKEWWHFLLHRCGPLCIRALPCWCFITAALSLMIQETIKINTLKITLRPIETGKQWSDFVLLPTCCWVM